MSQSRALHTFIKMSVLTFSFLPSLAIEAVLIPAASLKSFFSCLYLLEVSKAFYNLWTKFPPHFSYSY